MKRKVTIAAAAVVFIIALIFIARPVFHKKGAEEKAAQAVAVKVEKGKPSTAPAPTRKAVSKGMAALTVKILDTKNAPVYLNVKAFLSTDARTSVYVKSFQANKPAELLPGTYDIEIGTVPAKIHKNVNVPKDTETVEDLGCPTGSFNVKVLDSKKNPANYNILILYPKSNIIVASWRTNKPIELLPGVYDVSIEISPKRLEKGVKVDAGKETIVDLGCVSGSLSVKAADENGKQARLTVMLKNPATNETVAYGTTGKPMEVVPGTYNVDLLTLPAQSKKAIKINAGEEMTIEFLVKSPPPPAPPKAPAKAVNKKR